MNGLSRKLLERVGRGLGGLELRTADMAEGIVRILVSSRMTRLNGMEVAVYLVGSTLIDTCFVHASAVIVPFMARQTISAICLTHHHEDHSGAAGALAQQHSCPVYLRNTPARHEEGLAALKPYRLLWWGEPLPYDPLEMPERMVNQGRGLRVVPIPGHSATHTALFDESSGTVFTGDLFMTGGVTAVMSHEDPYQSVASLRRVADLTPRWMLTGHGLAVENPAVALRRKADRIERAASEVLRLHGQGMRSNDIVRKLFPKGRARDRQGAMLTSGEFSRANFVRACIRHAP